MITVCVCITTRIHAGVRERLVCSVVLRFGFVEQEVHFVEQGVHSECTSNPNDSSPYRK